MKLTYENIFLGAAVSKGEQRLTVYKINQKTFYAGNMDFEVFFGRYEKSPKGTTFKDFVAANKAELLSYEGFDITEEEIERGKTIGKKIDKNEKKFLSVHGERLIKEVFDTKYKKGRSFNYPLYDGSTEFHIVVANDDGKILFNMDNEYILFSVNTKKYFKIENVFAGTLKTETIPWNEV